MFASSCRDHAHGAQPFGKPVFGGPIIEVAALASLIDRSAARLLRNRCRIMARSTKPDRSPLPGFVGQSIRSFLHRYRSRRLVQRLAAPTFTPGDSMAWSLP